MIRFTCPACNASFHLPDDAAGKKGPCPKCGQRLQVPAPRPNRTVLGVMHEETRDELIRAEEPPPHRDHFTPGAAGSIPGGSPISTDLDDDDDMPRRWYQGMRPEAWAILAVVLILPIAGLIVVGVVIANRSTAERHQNELAKREENPKNGSSKQRPVEKETRQDSRDAKASSRTTSNHAPGVPKQPAHSSASSGQRHTESAIQQPQVRDSRKTRRSPVEDGAALPSQEIDSDSDTPIPVLGTLLDEVVTGYQTRRFQGFTFLLSTQAIKEGQKEKGKPFGALQAEFDGLVDVLPANALKHLRGILIWVEWDNIDRGNPKVLAKYYGGRIWTLDGSSHPLKSNAVEVLSLKRLAQEKAVTREKRRLVLLHELAHAVHHLALGFDNVDVVFAYNQAMDRRLYDKVKDSFGREVRAYAATNEAEYFAELTCAYLDRCLYFPFTRADLREHDPTGYRLMQKVWGDEKKPSRQKKQNRK